MRDSAHPPATSVAIVALLVLGGLFSPEFSAQTPYAPTPLTDSFRRLDELRIAGDGIQVDDLSIRIAHLELRLERGGLFPVVDREGLVIGLIFEGQGRYRYRSDDPVDRTMMTANLEREKLRAQRAGAMLEQPFERLVVLHAHHPYPEYWQELQAARRSGTPEQLSPGSSKAMTRLWGLFPSDAFHRIVHAQRAGEPRQFVIAAVETNSARVRYLLDTVHTHRESLSFFPVHGVVAGHTERVISVQPAFGSDPAQQAPALRLSRASLEVSSEDNRTASIRSDLELTVGRDRVRFGAFRLGDGRLPTRWSWLPGMPHQARLTRVLDADGRELDFHHAEGQVLVDLGAAYEHGSLLTLRFETDRVRLIGLSGDPKLAYFELLTTDWHPRPIGNPGGKFDFALKVRTPKPYVPIAPGIRGATEELEDYNELRVSCPVPAPYVAVFAGRYLPLLDAEQDPPIRVYSYGEQNREMSRAVATMARWFIRYYESFLGKFPYPALDIVEAPERGGFGVAGPGILVMSAEAFHPDPQGRFFYVGSWYKRLAHEIAHQWFGQQVTIGSERDEWLQEALAEYLAGLAILTLNRTEEWKLLAFDDLVRQWRATARQVPLRQSAALLAARWSVGRSRFGVPEALLYGRGPLVLRMLHGLTGDEAFFGALREMIARSADGPLTEGQFREIVEQAAGQEIGWFLDQWLTSSEVPKVMVEFRYGPTTSGRYMLFGALRQPAGQEFKILHVPFVVRTAEDDVQVHVVVQDQPLTPFHILLDERPERVLVDPGRINLVRYNVRARGGPSVDELPPPQNAMKKIR